MTLKAIDICAGAGGWAIAARGLPIEIVAAIDFAGDCCATYQYNHPEVNVIQEEVRDHDFTKYESIDLILGSVPCEEISVARMNNPPSAEAMCDWWKLLDKVFEAVEAIKPRYWCIENVPQMKKHLPIMTPWVILDSSYWSAQKRQRIFVGNFPLPDKNGDRSKSLSSCLLPGPYLIQANTLACHKISRGQWYEKGTKRIIYLDKPSPTITDFGSRHSRGFCIRLPDGRERSLQFCEAAKLQGFPEDYVFVSSQTRAWKMVAQAIQIDLGRAILKRIVKEEDHCERTEEIDL